VPTRRPDLLAEEKLPGDESCETGPRRRKRRKLMAKWVIVLLVGIGFLWVPSPSLGDCVSAQSYSFIFIKSDRDLVVYRENRPIVEIRFRDCRLSPDSTVFFTGGLICEGAVLLVDGKKCEAFSVKSTAFEHGP